VWRTLKVLGPPEMVEQVKAEVKRMRGMMGKKTGGMVSFANEFSLLKLAHNTLAYNFTHDRLRKAFSLLLCDTMTRMGVTYYLRTEFAKILFSGKMPEFISDNDIADSIKLLKRKYKISKKGVSSRLTHKYYFLLEMAYILSLSGMKRDSFSFTNLYAKLKINEEEQQILKKYVVALEAGEFSALPVIFENTKLENHSVTIRPLGEFIIHEYNYYNLPRRNVSVFSTMGAGKSTFINALLGHDYLPAKNEVCTTKIVSVADIDNIDYSLGYVVKNGNPVVCGNVDDTKIEEWNCDSDVSEIMLEGDLDRISSEEIVTVIHDTPGINYSGNPSHREITLKHLVDSKPEIIICLLDATQMLTTDFSDALEDLKKTNEKGSKAQVVFILNKADSYDSEKESLKETIMDTFDELKKHGFDDPIVISASSRSARLFKKALNGQSNFTENEIDDFSHYVRFFSRPENDFRLLAEGVSEKILRDAAYKTNGITKITLDGKDYDRDLIVKVLFNTGIPAIENFLNTQGDKIND
jgi:GTPase Era involved in 16S rRNA processing